MTQESVKSSPTNGEADTRRHSSNGPSRSAGNASVDLGSLLQFAKQVEEGN